MNEALQVQEPGTVTVQASQGDGIEALLTRAVDRGASVETMERLMVIRRELKAEAAKEAFIGAMARFQSKCPQIAKTSKVSFQSKSALVAYSYADLPSIVLQVQPVLEACGLSYSIDAKCEPGTVEAVITIRHILGHAETSSFRVPVESKAGMGEQQKYGAAVTFAKRYAFVNALGIMTADEDTDAGAKRGAQAPSKWGNATDATEVTPPTPPPASPPPPQDEVAELKRALWAAAPAHRGATWATYHQWLWDENILRPDEKTKDMPASRLAEVLAAVNKKVRAA